MAGWGLKPISGLCVLCSPPALISLSHQTAALALFYWRRNYGLNSLSDHYRWNLVVPWVEEPSALVIRKGGWGIVDTRFSKFDLGDKDSHLYFTNEETEPLWGGWVQGSTQVEWQNWSSLKAHTLLSPLFSSLFLKFPTQIASKLYTTSNRPLH